jgi:hypothetical protein
VGYGPQRSRLECLGRAILGRTIAGWTIGRSSLEAESHITRFLPNERPWRSRTEHDWAMVGLQFKNYSWLCWGRKSNMKQLVIKVTICAARIALAQQPPAISPLLDHLAGKWRLQGTVGNQPVTRDFDAGWVLQHHHLQFREVSREKNDQGEPQYEATVFIGWTRRPSNTPACGWMSTAEHPRNRSGSPRPRRTSWLSSLAMSTAKPASATRLSMTPRPIPGTTGSTMSPKV